MLKNNSNSFYFFRWILTFSIALICISTSNAYASLKPKGDIKGVYFKKERDPLTEEKYYEVRVKSTQRGDYFGYLKIYVELIDKDGSKYFAEDGFQFSSAYEREYERETTFKIPNLTKAKVNAYWVGLYYTTNEEVLLDSKDKKVDSLKPFLRKTANHISAEMKSGKTKTKYIY